ncbi:MAG TPA: NAD(P)H-binding protein [Arachidicoccus sp.]
MKIVVTGSLGYVSKPLVAQLVEHGHVVVVVSSNAEKQLAIEALGAQAAIGEMEDVNFLTETFTGADAVYCMLAMHGNFTDPENDAEKIIANAAAIAGNYVIAIERSGVKRVVYLSSIGAEMEEGSGLIKIHHNGEKILDQLPSDVSIAFIRPSGFYKNLFAFVHSIKQQNIIASNYGGDDINILVSNIDIADVITEELESDATCRKVRYVASEILTCNEVAHILGAAIGMPDLQWVTISNEEQLNGYKAFGMIDSLADQFVEMNASIHSGRFYEAFNRQKPMLGKITLKDFAKEFAAFYQQQ